MSSDMERPVGALTSRTVRGFLWAFTGSLGQAVLQMVAIVVLARLLTPHEFGAVAASTIVVGLCQLAAQLGVGAAVVQRHQLHDEEISAAVYFSVFCSILLAATLATLTPFFNRLVGLPAESDLLRLLSVTLVIGGFAAVPAGLLQRRLEFRGMAVVDLVAFGPATIGVSVVLALLGEGPFALIWGHIAASSVTAVGYYLLARPPLRPTSPRLIWLRVQPLIRFGAGYAISQFGNWMALNGDNIVVANALGPAPLGAYTRAYGLLSQPANLVGSAVDKALYPAMARVQHDGERLRTAYVSAASLVALITVPISVQLVVLAPEVVDILLGPAWTMVIVPLQVFAAVLLPRTSYKISGSLTRATGAVYRGAWRQWLYAAEVVTGCLIGSFWGLNGVAVGASVAIVLHFLVMLRFSARVAKGLARSVLTMYVRHIPIGVVTFLIVVGVAGRIRPAGTSVGTLLAAGLSGVLGAAITLLVMRRWFRTELEVLRKLIRS